jgi:hypothetical protein
MSAKRQPSRAEQHKHPRSPQQHLVPVAATLLCGLPLMLPPTAGSSTPMPACCGTGRRGQAALCVAPLAAARWSVTHIPQQPQVWRCGRVTVPSQLPGCHQALTTHTHSPPCPWHRQGLHTLPLPPAATRVHQIRRCSYMPHHPVCTKGIGFASDH